MAVFIRALHPGKAVLENSAAEVFFDLFVDDRPEKAVFLLVFLVIYGLKLCVGLAEYPVNGCLAWPALTVCFH